MDLLLAISNNPLADNTLFLNNRVSYSSRFIKPSHFNSCTCGRHLNCGPWILMLLMLLLPDFSEENVWKLCEQVKRTNPNELERCYAVFVSNVGRTVPLWRQKVGRGDDKVVIWVSELQIHPVLFCSWQWNQKETKFQRWWPRGLLVLAVLQLCVAQTMLITFVIVHRRRRGWQVIRLSPRHSTQTTFMYEFISHRAVVFPWPHAI